MHLRQPISNRTATLVPYTTLFRSQASSIFDQFWNSDQVVPIAVVNQASPGDLQSAIADIDDEALQARAQPYLERVAAAPSVRDYLQQQLRPVWTDRLQVVSDPPSKRGDDSREDWLVTSLLDMLRGARDQAWLIWIGHAAGRER